MKLKDRIKVTLKFQKLMDVIRFLQLVEFSEICFILIKQIINLL